MTKMEMYLYGSYGVALAAIIGYQLYVQNRLKTLTAKVEVMRADKASPRREAAS